MRWGISLDELAAVLQIISDYTDNFGIIIHVFTVNVFCDPSLEPPRGDGSNEGSQHMFSLGNNKKLSLNYHQYPLFIWRSD